MRHSSGRAFTLVEVMVVGFLAMILFGSGMLIFRGSTLHVQKGTEMLDAQALLDRIEHQLRHDVRRLRTIESCTEHQVSFFMANRGQDTRVEYRYDPHQKSLQRTEQGPPARARLVGDRGTIETCRFSALVTDDVFERLDVLLQINTDSRPEATPDHRNTRLTVAAQYTSRCRKPYRPWSEPTTP